MKQWWIRRTRVSRRFN